ncbi:MAG: biotin/lipoyl-binding protein, partial [Candidatus Hermodarchaeota archaeon]
MKTRKIIYVFGILTMAIACTTEKQEQQTDNRIKVKTAMIREELVTIPVHAVGRVYAKEEAKLAFKTGGIIKNILADEGDVVRKGQVLAVLNLAEIEAQV